MFLKTILSIVKPSQLALQSAATLAGALLGTEELELHLLDKTGDPEFRRSLDRILAIAPPERVHVQVRPAHEPYTRSILAVPTGPTDQVVLVHDDDIWLGQMGGTAEDRRTFAAVLPTIVVFGANPLIAWAPTGGACATAPGIADRLTSLRFDMREYTPYPFLFGAMGPKAWSAASRFLESSPMHLPTWDRVMSLAVLGTGASRLAEDWTYFYDYGKWNSKTAHDEYIKWLAKLGFEGYSAMGALLLRTLYALDQLVLLDLLGEDLAPEDHAAILRWIAFDTVGYFRRKIYSQESLTPSLALQWEAVRAARHKGPNPLLDVFLAREFPVSLAEMRTMLLDPLKAFGLPALEPQIDFWEKAMKRLEQRFAAQAINPVLAWEGR